MAPEVTVPMDFGRHLLRSPTHNNLTLKTKEGGEVTASSVILSYNSPVIDHMTTTLHMTSVDMLEFSEAAVRMFVDSAYSGTADEITRETFRDLNKISSVFEVEWLVEKCHQYFCKLSKSVKVPNYTDLLFLFEEGAYVHENLKRKELLTISFEKMSSLKWKSQFLEEYLVNAGRLSTQKLDLVIELAGNDVEFIVQILTRQLSELVLNQVLPKYCEYLLENSDLSLCRQSNKILFDELFDLLDNLPDEKMRWTFRLLKENSRNNIQSREDTTPVPSLSLIPGKKPNMIPNLYRYFDVDYMSFDEVYQWLLISDEVDSIILAIEAISTWNWYRCYKNRQIHISFNVESDILKELLNGLRSIRGWSRLPYSFASHNCLGGLPLSSLSLSVREDPTYYYLTPEVLHYPKNQWIDLLRKPTKFMFRFKHPAVVSCNLPGQCGFILETVPSDLALWELRLCTEEEEYDSSPVHFHDEICSENMHVYYDLHKFWTSKKKHFSESILCPLTWLGFLLENNVILDKFISWTRSNTVNVCSNIRLGVLYKI